MPFFRRVLFNRTLYYIVFTLFTLLYNFCYVSRYMNYSSNVFLVCWGLILLVYDLCGRRFCMGHCLRVPFLLFLGVFAVTILLHALDGFFDNGLLFLVTAVEFFVLSAYDFSKRRRDALHELSLIARTVIIASFPLSLGSLVLFALKMKVKAYGIIYGFVEGRLYGFYTNPNSGSMVAFFSIAFSLMLMLILKRRFRKLLLLNLAVQFLYLTLSLSRGSQAALVVFGLFFSFFLFQQKSRIKRIGRRIAAGVVAALVSVCVLALALELSKLALSYVPETVNYVEKVIVKQPAEKSISPVPIERDYSKGFFSPRSIIWKVGLDIFQESPVFGVGPYLIPVKSKPYLSPKYQQHVEIGGLHNNYLQVLVSCGVAGLLVFIVILFMMNRIYMRYLSDCLRRRHRPFALFGSMTGLTTALLVYNLVESKILLDNCMVSAIFWIISGYIICFCLQSQRAEKRQSYDKPSGDSLPGGTSTDF